MPLCQISIKKSLSFRFLDSYNSYVKELLKQICRNMGKIMAGNSFGVIKTGVIKKR